MGVSVAGQSVPLFLSLSRLSVALFYQVSLLSCSVGFQDYSVLLVGGFRLFFVSYWAGRFSGNL